MKGQELKGQRCSPGDSHASRFPQQGQNGALQTPAISGRRCAASLQSYDPVTCLARMLLTSSIWGCTKRSLTWSRRDTPQGHSYFLLAPSAHGMSGNGRSSSGLMFPTPLASDTGVRRAVSRITLTPGGAFRSMRASGKRWAAMLSEAVYFLEPEADGSLRINPEWVEWMMGFPRKWTEV